MNLKMKPEEFIKSVEEEINKVLIRPYHADVRYIEGYDHFYLTIKTCDIVSVKRPVNVDSHFIYDTLSENEIWSMVIDDPVIYHYPNPYEIARVALRNFYEDFVNRTFDMKAWDTLWEKKHE